MDDFATRSARLAELRAQGKAPVTYDILIDEPQRVALRDLIASDGVGRPGMEALEYWLDMLDGLPDLEAKAPGIVHGFCL